MILRLFKLFIGLLLLPVCGVATVTLIQLIARAGYNSWRDIPPNGWAFAIGFMLWLILYHLLAPPVRAYVLAHELTHALWAWCMGARVHGIRVSDRGGHVKLDKINFWITLAPYFFPFYTICILILYNVLSLFYDVTTYDPFWMGCLGLSWAFHLSFTLSMLRTHQTDITENGYIFSYALIYLLNGVMIWLALFLLDAATLADSGRLFQANARAFFIETRNFFKQFQQ